ncbi:voltage-dependent T-type calcium channel subunit alpha-1H-like isoform X1 [Acropora palmata]|uniref:voltage-dependent T-type calcium channel subunit alpha-1H-like isoform X1 n=1 Tax=Acropora palmata TaxID=6131 RepID=UPI003DA1A09B
MFVIFVNCVILAMYNPLDENCTETRCRVLENVEHFVFAFFCAEMVIKMVAMGVTGNRGYLQDKWNRLDCLIVMIGLIEKVISNNNYLTIIRAFRVLRPLRAINKVPSIRILVTLLLDTLPMLGNVLLLSFLIFFVFGIISVQLWQGKLRNRCFTNFPENSSFFTRYNRSTFYKPSFDEPDFVCSLPEDGGTSRCSNISPKDTNCSGSFEDNSINWKKYYNICKEVGPNPFYDLVSFDNIGIAWIVIFQVITLEGWSDIMYFVQDAHSSLSWIYFVVLIVVGSFFLVNLCLVVITMQFQETKAREIELIESTKDEAQPNSSEPLRAVIKFAKNLCWCRTEDEPQVHHHHHHHFYHHHHFHHHMYNCYQPASPGIFHSTPTNEPSFIFPSSDIPNIQVGGDAAMGFPSNAEQCEINPDFLAPPDRVSRRNSKTSICSHTLSIHSETSSEVSFQGIVAQSKSSVTLNVPSPTANGSFFAFASSNSAQASRKNSFNESSEVSSSVTVFADINPRSVGTGTAQDKETKSKRYPKREHKPLTRPKEKDLLKHRRLSQPAHLIEMNSSPQSPNVSSYSPSEMLDQSMSCIDFNQNERNRDQSEIEKVLSCADLSISEFPLKTQGSDNQTKVTSSKPNKHPQIQRGATTQSEDDMFESLFNLRQSASYDVTARRGAWQSLRALCRKVAASKHFTFFIMVIILLNMICMAPEHYNQPDFLTDAMEITNKIFVCIFSFEMVIKLLGDGIAMYLSSGQNVFDGIIVIVSVCEILLSRQTSALSVFRSIRLLRIFKLVRPVRYQLLVVIKTMTSVMTFFGLLFLFIFAFAILGMNLFGGKFEFPNKEGKSVTSRSNFDSFLWAMVSVFQILTQENWNLVMYDGMRTTNKWAALYFTALMAIGYYVLFNLLVAILVEGFTNTGKPKPTPKTEEQKGQNSNSGKEDTPKISKTFYGSQNCCPGGYYHDDLPEFCGHGLRNALGSTFRLKTNNFNTNSFASLKQDQAAQRKLGKRLPDKSDYTRESLETYRLTMPELKRMRKVPASMILKIERIPQNTADNSSTNKRGFVITGNDMEDRRACISTKDVANFPVEATLKNMLEDEEERGYCSHESTGGDQWRDIPKASLPDPVGRQVNADRQTNDDMYHHQQELQTSAHETQTKKRQWAKFTVTRQNWSLYLFAPSNRFRCRMASVCGHKYFDYVVLLFILISCIVLAMEEPNILPKKRQIIDATMLLLTVIFTFEMMMKVVAHGFVVGPGTYLKDGWNVLDGSLVLVSLIDVIITYRSIFTLSRTSASEVLGTLKVFRALRTLRPLRMIRRAPGLKLVVQTLLYSLKPIGNTVLIAAIFFVMFGILGVQIFKGKFHYCKGNDNVTNKAECEQGGNKTHWENRMYNFDNLAQALISLFVFSTRDGWVKIMHNGIDAVGIDQQPITNYAEWRLVYFIPFLMLGGFLVLNMIVGVVVENFQRCRERLEDEEKQKKRKKLLGKVKTEKQEDDKRNYSEGYSKWRLRILGICLHPYWDVSIAIVILVNVICMSLEHYQMPKSLEVFVEIANYFFTGVFVLEVVVKFIAFGFARYFRDRWNLVDLVIVVLSLAGIIIESLNSARNVLKIMINPTVARSLRVLRFIRVLKLVKLAKGVRSLLDTLFEALPQVANLGLLFLLLFFIYSCLGIQLFGNLKCCPSHPCQGLGPHAHFRDFGTAMLTLFRIATGDNWNGILEDTLRCSSEDKCEEYCCVSKYTAPLFFFTFVLAAQFVLVNVVIAVLMKHLKESKEKIAANMAVKDLEKKLKLLTLSAKNFIKAKARRSDPVTTSRRQSIVQLGLSGIELVQLRQSEAPETVKKSAFCTDLARADAIFQEFLRLNDNLRMVKMTIVRTSSHNTEHVTPTPVTQYPRRRRNTLSGIRELQKTSSNLKKYTVYKSGTEL